MIIYADCLGRIEDAHVEFSHFAKPRWRPVTCVCTGSRGWFVFELPQQTVSFLNRVGEEKKHGCSIFAKECFLGLINNCRNFLSRSKLLTILSMFSAAKQNRSGDHAGVFQIIQGGGWWPHCEPVFMFSLIDFEIQWLPYGSTTYSTGVWSANWLLELCLLMYSLVFH